MADGVGGSTVRTMRRSMSLPDERGTRVQDPIIIEDMWESYSRQRVRQVANGETATALAELINDAAPAAYRVLSMAADAIETAQPGGAAGETPVWVRDAEPDDLHTLGAVAVATLWHSGIDAGRIFAASQEGIMPGAMAGLAAIASAEHNSDTGQAVVRYFLGRLSFVERAEFIALCAGALLLADISAAEMRRLATLAAQAQADRNDGAIVHVAATGGHVYATRSRQQPARTRRGVEAARRRAEVDSLNASMSDPGSTTDPDPRSGTETSTQDEPNVVPESDE